MAETNRPLAHFQANIWEEHFISSPLLHLETEQASKHQKLKEQVRELLLAGLDKPWEQLDLIDSIQRSGVAYHFEDEIENLLQRIHKNLDTCLEENDNLHFISLLFRLLRQSSLTVSCDVFNKFKDDSGKLKESLIEDVIGLLSLHEAACMRLHGEDILEQAFDFTTTYLKSIVEDTSSSSKLAAQASQALKYPVRKNIPRLEAKYYISVYPLLNNPVVLTFAKLDFNILQKLHQNELREIVRWWKDLDIPRRLPYARDRITELFFWAIGVYYEPCYALGRKILTKVFALTSFLDDMYDAYGTIEELELLTQAIQRWDRNAMDGLNNKCSKELYQILLDVYDEIGEDMAKLGKSYRLNYAVEMMKGQARTYLTEARWFSQNYTPTFEEYLKRGINTSACPLLTLSSLLGIGDDISRDAFEWILSTPKSLIASSLTGRLADDIMSHEFEKKRGHADTAVECYMKEYGATKQETVKELYKRIESAWKDMNEELLQPTEVPKAVLMRVLNFTRCNQVVYADADAYTFPDYLKDFVAALLVHQLPLD
uniref:(+)-delta-cadinene synthase n=1 Tax=Aquilaria sinensis TaxID=210372 RepID=T2D1J3_9ROSI|nr:putative (-)-germacrene-D synthase [Aquilaria sinensis]